MLPNTYEEANAIYNRKKTKCEKKKQRKFDKDVRKCRSQIAYNCYQAMKNGEKWYDFSPGYFWLSYWGTPIRTFSYDVVDKALEELKNEYGYLKYSYEIVDNLGETKARLYLVCGWEDVDKTQKEEE